MKAITLLAVIAILLLELSGAMLNSSVGGPLTIMLILFLAMLAVGFHEAWLKKRGALGWIVSIVASVIGGFLAVNFGSTAMEMILPRLDLKGSRPRNVPCSISCPQAWRSSRGSDHGLRFRL
jgi:hypothetical protein